MRGALHPCQQTLRQAHQDHGAEILIPVKGNPSYLADRHRDSARTHTSGLMASGRLRSSSDVDLLAIGVTGWRKNTAVLSGISGSLGRGRSRCAAAMG